MKIIKAVMFANGMPCPHEGQYLKEADFEAHDGRGFMTFTKDINRAMKFEGTGQAMAFWSTRSKTHPTRPDGQPNRPLTALSVEIMDAPQ